jgi:hypothetical protein
MIFTDYSRIKSAVAFFFLFFHHGTSIGNGQQGISYNGLQIGDVADFGTLNYL